MYGGYGIFGGDTLHSDKHKYRDIGELISEARHYKREQEPEKVTKSLQVGLLKAMEASHISSFERQVKMAKEIPEEDWKKIKNGEMKHRIEDEVVVVKFTKDVDMEKTLDGIKIGKKPYDPDGKTVISEAGMQQLRDAINKAHENGQTSVTIKVPMSYNHGGDVYDLDPETKEPIPILVKDANKVADAFQAGQFKKVEGHEGLYKHQSNNRYIKIDAENPAKIYEADKDGNLKYKKHYEEHPPMYIKNDKAPGYKFERPNKGEDVKCDEEGFRIDENGKRIPEIQHYTVTVDFQYTVGMQIKDQEGNNLTQGVSRNLDGSVKKDVDGNPEVSGKLAGNADRNSQEWKQYVDYMARMEHVGEKYARDPKMEAIRDFGLKSGKFAANEAFRTTVNMAVRTPIQAEQEATRGGERQISQFVQMLMPAIKGQTR